MLAFKELKIELKKNYIEKITFETFMTLNIQFKKKIIFGFLTYLSKTQVNIFL